MKKWICGCASCTASSRNYPEQTPRNFGVGTKPPNRMADVSAATLQKQIITLACPDSALKSDAGGLLQRCLVCAILLHNQVNLQCCDLVADVSSGQRVRGRRRGMTSNAQH